MKRYNRDSFIHSTLKSGRDFFIKDKWKKEYHFKIASFPVPSGLASEAREVRKDDFSGYVFNILSDIDTPYDAAEEKLARKIRREINRRYMESRNGERQIGEKDMLCGRIEFNEDFSDTEFDRVFVIDGKRITIEEFRGMLEPWEGWHFQFKIKDATAPGT